MKARVRPLFRNVLFACGAAAACLMFVSGCEMLRPAASATPPGFYTLDSAPIAARAVSRESPVAAPTLVVSVPRAAPGFDSQRIIYVRQPHQLEYFAHSEWIDTPARMLAPLLVSAIESGSAFRAVVLAPSSASGDLRLDTEVLQLQHEFAETPSRVRFMLRAHLVDASRRVIASRDFEAVALADSDDPYAGVAAANQAVRTVLEKLSAFCADAVARGLWQRGGEVGKPSSKPY